MARKQTSAATANGAAAKINSRHGLAAYRAKRDFTRTPEPGTPEPAAGKPTAPKPVAASHRLPRFVVQKHDASHLHYDFRLEIGGVLCSWAVPKGPSLDPNQKRLAVRTEDHPLAYAGFEGVIPQGEYGGGTVMLWDRGRFEAEGDPRRGLRKGELKFTLHGRRLHGSFALVRMKPRDADKRHPRESWLLIKHRDRAARPGSDDAILRESMASVASGRPMRRIAAASKPEAARHDRLTHPDRLLWPGDGLTKADLAAYWQRAAAFALPHIAGRPLALVRCPDGIEAGRFFQKKLTPGFPDSVFDLVAGDEQLIGIEDAEGLQGLAQMAAIEIHPWGCRNDRLDRPEHIVIDLDPGPGLGFDAVVQAARDVRAMLDAAGLVAFCKTTGGKGLHVAIPFRRGPDWDTVKQTAHALASRLAETEPQRFTDAATKTIRRGRIFVDYLRNTRGATAVAPFSPRARPGATIAMPLRWSQVKPGLDPTRWTIRAPTRVLRAGALAWAEYFAVADSQTLSAKVRRVLGVRG